MSVFQLPEGPITDPRFVLVNWLSFVDDTGRNCFETHTLMQIFWIAIRHRSDLENMQYASILQKGTVA